MVLETHMKLCMTEPNFPEFFFVLNDGIMDQKLRPFEFFEKFDGYFLLKLYYNKNFYYLLVFVQKSHIWEKILCRDISQNVISQLICRIF